MEPLYIVVHICWITVGDKLNRWKVYIRKRDRKSVFHGNSLKPHETNHVAAACTIQKMNMKAQPYWHHFYKRDGVFVSLILLLMKRRRKIFGI
jgi:hypothetical protein